MSAAQLRAASVIAAGSLALHQLRYLLVFRDDTEAALAHSGHHYLSFVTPLVAALLALFLGRFVRLAGSGRRRRRPRRPLAAAWLLASACLLTVYVVQEWLEAALIDGRVGGVAGVFDHGGWSAIGLSLLIGALVTVALRGASEAVSIVVVRTSAHVPRLRSVVVGIPLVPERRAVDVLAWNLAGRGPPSTSG